MSKVIKTIFEIAGRLDGSLMAAIATTGAFNDILRNDHILICNVLPDCNLLD